MSETSDATDWHETYQQAANDFDKFLGELLDLLPGATETGSDAYDQIPRAIEALRAELDRRALLLGKHRETVGVIVGQREELRAERDAAYALIRNLVDPDDCSFDHHGGCQAHGYLSLEPGERCPQAEAKELIAGLDTDA